MTTLRGKEALLDVRATPTKEILMDTNKTNLAEIGERMAFEAYMKRDRLGIRPTPDGAGSYAVTEVRWAWEAWQVRASLGAPGETGDTSGVAEMQPDAWQYRRYYSGDDAGWGFWQPCTDEEAEKLKGRSDVQVRALYARTSGVGGSDAS